MGILTPEKKEPARRLLPASQNEIVRWSVWYPEGPYLVPLWNSGPKSIYDVWYGFWALIPYGQSKWTLWGMLLMCSVFSRVRE